MSADNRARYVVSLIRNDDATTRSGANKMPCCLRLQYYGLVQNRQLVLVCADCWCEIVGSDGAINIRWGGRGGVSQVIRSEGQNDTGLSSGTFHKSAGGRILETPHLVLSLLLTCARAGRATL